MITLLLGISQFQTQLTSIFTQHNVSGQSVSLQLCHIFRSPHTLLLCSNRISIFQVDTDPILSLKCKSDPHRSLFSKLEVQFGLRLMMMIKRELTKSSTDRGTSVLGFPNVLYQLKSGPILRKS